MLIESNQRGFSLLEVMVALVVLSVGLLGVVKLETVAYASTNIASKRSIAALEAASLAASMHVNRGYWTKTDTSGAIISVTGTTTGTTVSVTQNATALAAVVVATQDCTSTSATLPCSPVIAAAYDLQKWAGALQGPNPLQPLLPNYQATITCGTQNPVSCMINLTWNENAVAINSQETGVLASPSYTLYVEP
jgi:type IV pilus assembly protein PilV